uniref:Ig-like domain-containing protein n=1 Tax=Echeneis naucrates TaxID=173247 RepID=A0A665WVP6_ECHNA
CFHGVLSSFMKLSYYVETSGCSKIIRAPVGGKVVLPSCLSPEGVTSSRWMFKETVLIAVLDKENPPTQFRGRGEMCSNYSLILTKLTHEDSGNYSFVSEVNGRQRGTTIITLHVYDPITGPVLTANTSLTVNGSCSVVLKCNSSSDSIKSYTWTVKNRTSSGSHEMQYFISPQDGETKFTCTIKTSDAEMSVSRTEKCSNDTSLLPEESGRSQRGWIYSESQCKETSQN